MRSMRAANQKRIWKNKRYILILFHKYEEYRLSIGNTLPTNITLHYYVAVQIYLYQNNGIKYLPVVENYDDNYKIDVYKRQVLI